MEEKYEAIHLTNGKLFLIRGGYNHTGNEASNIYMLEYGMDNGAVHLSIARLDQGVLMQGHKDIVIIKESMICMSYEVDRNSDIVRQLDSVDKECSCRKAGLVLGK
ncbi:MAG: hypothetical protein ACRCZB_05300 [Bacteroidales bacterium]